jgi:hypothetical protein
MTIDEARAVWLTKMGSGWVNELEVLLDDGVLWEAYTKLRLSDSLDKDLASLKMKLKCKS